MYQEWAIFPQVNLENLAKAFQEKIGQNLVSLMSAAQLSEDVVYITQRFLDWLDSGKYAI